MIELPEVSVLVCIRNESRFIARTLEAILAQDYPSERIEILVIDGMSEDKTRQIVSDFARRDARVRLLDNPKQIVSSALNIGIRACRGEIIVRVDGHTVIARDYVRRCVDALDSTNADNVGGLMNAVSETEIGNSIALATSSPFGVGNARFHYATIAQWVDTVYMGAFRHEVFERIGLFDEELVRNQDDEFNFRLTLARGRIWLDPEIRSTYYSRSTVRGLWKQYFEYGFWKVRVIQKHRRPASVRHLVPALFALALLGSLILAVVFQSIAWLLPVLVPYWIVASVFSIRIAAHHGWQYGFILPIIFAVLHLAYGTGFIIGVIRFSVTPFTIAREKWTT